MYQYILFDLDGTITDPKEGITKSVQHALRSFGIEEDNLDVLEPFIGPPLRDSFREFYGIDGEDTERAVKVFRERFEAQGIKENVIYPGMQQMLRDLKSRGYLLAIASSKPQEFVHIVLRNFEIEDCFSVIVGSEKDGKRDTKIEVMEEAVSRIKKKAGRRFSENRTLMVGDRKFDVEAARQLGIACAAVTYGYAPEGELMKCEPAYLVDSVSQLKEVITGEKEYVQHKSKHAFSKTIEILLPLLLYWALQLLVYNLLYLAVARIAPAALAREGQLSVWLNGFSAVATWPLLFRWYGRDGEKDTSHVICRRKKRVFRREALLVAAYAMTLAVGLNMLVAYFQLANMSESYTRVAGSQYSVSLLVGLVIYGFLTPVTEELLFRGIIYSRIRKYFPVPLAMLLGGLIFGCYHGNPVQMIYACIMGAVMSLVYEYYDRLLAAPIVFHCSANLIVYVMSKANAFAGNHIPVFYGIALVAVACGVTCFYLNQYRRKLRIRYGNQDIRP